MAEKFRGRELGKSGFAEIRTPNNPNRRANRSVPNNARTAAQLNAQVSTTTRAQNRAQSVTAAELNRQITIDRDRTPQVDPITSNLPRALVEESNNQLREQGLQNFAAAGSAPKIEQIAIEQTGGSIDAQGRVIPNTGISLMPKALVQSIKQLLSGDPSVYYSNTIKPFSASGGLTNTNELTGFERNSDFFARGLKGFTSPVAYNSRRGNLVSGTPITRRHIISTDHANYHPQVNDFLYFVLEDNTVVKRQVVNETSIMGDHTGFDTNVSILDEDLPETMEIPKLLPPDFWRYLDQDGIVTTKRAQGPQNPILPDGSTSNKPRFENPKSFPYDVNRNNSVVWARPNDNKSYAGQLAGFSVLTNQNRISIFDIEQQTVTNPAGDDFIKNDGNQISIFAPFGGEINDVQTPEGIHKDYYIRAISGDSGSPWFYVINDQMYQVGMYSGITAGPSMTVGEYQDRLQDAINDLNESQGIDTEYKLNIEDYETLDAMFTNQRELRRLSQLTSYTVAASSTLDSRTPSPPYPILSHALETFTTETTSFEVDFTTANDGAILGFSIDSEDSVPEYTIDLFQASGFVPTLSCTGDFLAGTMVCERFFPPRPWLNFYESDKYYGEGFPIAPGLPVFSTNSQTHNYMQNTLDAIVDGTRVDGVQNAGLSATQNTNTKFRVCVPGGTEGTLTCTVSVGIPDYSKPLASISVPGGSGQTVPAGANGIITVRKEAPQVEITGTNAHALTLDETLRIDGFDSSVGVIVGPGNSEVINNELILNFSQTPDPKVYEAIVLLFTNASIAEDANITFTLLTSNVFKNETQPSFSLTVQAPPPAGPGAESGDYIFVIDEFRDLLD